MPSVPLHVATDHPAFAGHFPGQPLLPGVVLIAEVWEAVLADPASAAALGATPKLGTAKFLGAVRPGAALRIDWECTANRVRFDVVDVTTDSQPRPCATGHFERSGGPA